MLKQASLFEIVAARGWNVLNEGKTFTPVFVGFAFVTSTLIMGAADPLRLLLSFLVSLPFFLIYYRYEFPLHLRRWLWLPVIGLSVYMGMIHQPAIFPWLDWVWALGWYVFFTVFFWGTLYYHLRIGAPWTNFTRIWKLFLVTSDSTSGNYGEQVPKMLLLLLVLRYAYDSPAAMTETVPIVWGMAAIWFVAAAVIDRYGFNWKPQEYQGYTVERQEAAHAQQQSANKANKAVVIVIDGCRKDRLEQTHTPFLDSMIKKGTYFEQMETIYPARTVCCFSSMFTGTYPSEHGIKSNMVWKLGVQAESLFDVLENHEKKGILFGCAHLIDAFGDDVESFTSVAHNDEVDSLIMRQAKAIVEREKPDVMVIQMISVDQAGHSRGVHFDEYIQKISESDALIADFYHWMGEQGYGDDTLWIVMADHGQGDGIGGHGYLDEGERFVPFIMHGPGVAHGKRVSKLESIVSVAPTIAHWLGLPFPKQSRGRVLEVQE